MVASADISEAFQFLIGRLKTIFEKMWFFGSLEFQFLIGRLKTEFVGTECEDLRMFQFLIGRLKTKVSRLYILHQPCFNSL